MPHGIRPRKEFSKQLRAIAARPAEISVSPKKPPFAQQLMPASTASVAKEISVVCGSFVSMPPAESGASGTASLSMAAKRPISS